MPRVIEVIEAVETYSDGKSEQTVRSLYTLRGELLGQSILEEKNLEQKETQQA